MLPLETVLAGLLVLGGSAAALAVRRAGFSGPAGTNSRAREFEVLPPPDHAGPAELMLAELARSSAIAPVSGPRLLGTDRAAAFGRAVRVSAREISYRDFTAGALAAAHPSRLEHFYPGIRVIPRKEAT